MPQMGRSVPASATGVPPEMSCARESERECAGSVDTTSVGTLCAAMCVASAAAHVVLPTPPLPPSM